MPLFRYRAIRRDKKKISGHVEAATSQEAKRQLRDQGLMLVSIELGANSQKGVRLKSEALGTFTLQLSQLLEAGMPLYDALRALEEQGKGEASHPILLGLCEKVRGGISLSEAMGSYPDSFDGLYRTLVGAGEAAGDLSGVLERLRLFLHKQEALKGQLITALIYPAVLGGFSLLMVAMLLGFVVPSLETMFEDREVNGLTQAVLAVSRFLSQGWPYLLPLFVGLAFVVRWGWRQSAFQHWLQEVTLHVPVLRSLVIRVPLARFCRTMGTLLDGGLPLVEALHLAKGALHHHSLEKVMAEGEEKIAQGSSLSVELAKESLIPPLMAKMVAIGEETGGLAKMFHRIAEMYEQDVEKYLSRLTALAQPVILIVMGGVVGVVLLAVLLPLLDVSGFGGP